ncbi:MULTISPECIES: Nif11-like leader peptide family RiPP precursor [Anoxynatronum]|uniref:Nif11-like leader peptide domain-containing protein n=2 Tax=Anoxynatronum TaxID=210622 RepID=A0AA45WW60_9CLOT|nr:Nif11-like leader peptide family RiPP precursor [Anoxynatronum buryatiense]SMP57967.1 nif11-like leader peptide domain-containing protein [Anoxynatronum buryatiense]
MEEKLKWLFRKLEAEEQLAEKLFQQETPEEVQVLLKENSLEMTIEEIIAARDILNRTVAPSEAGELSEEDLDNVAGGYRGHKSPKTPGYYIIW